MSETGKNCSLAVELPQPAAAAGAASEADQHVLAQVRSVVEAARSQSARAVNAAMVEAYWLIGKQISDVVGERAAYGQHLVLYLSRNLTAEFGRGFTPANLRNMRQFYQAFPIRYTLCSELSWSHYRLIMRLPQQQAREFYVRESAASRWSVRELRRQMETRLFERLLHTQQAQAQQDMPDCERALAALKRTDASEVAAQGQAAKVFKDPYVLEFLDIPPEQSVLETQLETMLIDRLEDFMLELGRGFAYVGRQRRISDESNDYWIDLVFYNYFLKRFVLIDLKTRKITPQDVGQMDFYLHLFDDQCRVPGDEPSIGIILCASKDETVARYSALARNSNLLAAQYLTYLPTEDELETVLRRNRLEFEQLAAPMHDEQPAPKK